MKKFLLKSKIEVVMKFFGVFFQIIIFLLNHVSKHSMS